MVRLLLTIRVSWRFVEDVLCSRPLSPEDGDCLDERHQLPWFGAVYTLSILLDCPFAHVVLGRCSSHAADGGEMRGNLVDIDTRSAGSWCILDGRQPKQTWT